jgi:hypothetical protein
MKSDEGSGTKPADEYTFSMERGIRNHELRTSSLVHRRIISPVKTVETVGDRL